MKRFAKRLTGPALLMVALVASGNGTVGRPLLQSEKQVIMDAVKLDLKYPDSARFKWMPYRDDANSRIIYCGLVDSHDDQNRYQGYFPFIAGVTRKDGSLSGLIEVAIALRVGADWQASIRKRCREKGYPDFSSAR